MAAIHWALNMYPLHIKIYVFLKRIRIMFASMLQPGPKIYLSVLVILSLSRRLEYVHSPHAINGQCKLIDYDS